MNATTFIYALCESNTKIIRYFGKTDNPKNRLRVHLKTAKNGEEWPVSRWIRKRLKIGQRPVMRVLCEVPQDDFVRFERAFIVLGRQHGFRLLNATDGGEGASGATPSPETRAKQSAALKGRPYSSEHCANLRTKKSANTSGFVGISWTARLNKWQAAFGSNRKTQYVGVFSKIEDAVFARNLAIANLLSGATKPGKNRRNNTSGFVGVWREKKGWRARVTRSKNKLWERTFKKIEDAVFARNLAIANLL